MNIHPTKTEIKFEEERAIWQIVLASVRESLGKFSIVPPMDFDQEGYLDFPVSKGSSSIPPPPSIEINREFNPFGSDNNYQRPAIQFDGEGKEKSNGWENLYHGMASSDLHKAGGSNDKEFAAGPEQSRRFMQLRNRYILCPVKSGLMVIDQRRAHQRILFERFNTILSGNSVASQNVHVPCYYRP